MRSVTTPVADLDELRVAKGSKLINVPFTFETTNQDHATKTLLETLAYEKIANIDTVIFNAGLGTDFVNISSTSIS